MCGGKWRVEGVTEMAKQEVSVTYDGPLAKLHNGHRCLLHHNLNCKLDYVVFKLCVHICICLYIYIHL